MPIDNISKQSYETHDINTKYNVILFILGINFFFIVFPEIDINVSRYFFKSGSFVLSKNHELLAARNFHRISQLYFLLLMLVLIVVYTFWRRPLSSISPHKVIFIVLNFLLGSGVLVQVLKILIGRARPRDLMMFGGVSDFTPAWQFAGICHRNCSFPSGEASAAAAMLPLILLVPRALRGVVVMILVPGLAFVSINRVFMGAHFLSDVVISWTLNIGLMLWLWPKVYRNADMIDGWIRFKGAKLRERFINR